MISSEQQFQALILNSDDSSVVCAASVLTDCLRKSNATTFSEIIMDLERTITSITNTAILNEYLALKAGCELFKRYVIRIIHDQEDFQVVKNSMLKRGEFFTSRAMNCRQLIADKLISFLQHNMTLLIHGYSRTVVKAIIYAAKKNRRQLRLLVTESLPDNAGQKVVESILEAVGPQHELSFTMIRDCSVATALHSVDAVLVGADGVVESGGIINKVGTYQIALLAKSLGKPLYVAVESFKFVRQYPLEQKDVVQPPNWKDDKLLHGLPPCVEGESRFTDYTPPEYITLLFTDLGPLTPSAVSDELIKLYYEPLLTN